MDRHPLADSIADVAKLAIVAVAAVASLWVYATEFDETEVRSLIAMATAIIPAYVGAEAGRRWWRSKHEDKKDG